MQYLTVAVGLAIIANGSAFNVPGATQLSRVGMCQRSMGINVLKMSDTAEVATKEEEEVKLPGEDAYVEGDWLDPEGAVYDVNDVALEQVLDADGNPDTEFFRRFGHLKGAEVKTVSQTMKAFNDKYRRPIFAQYRNIVTEILQSTHLTVVCAMFTYDNVFAFGLNTMFDKLLGSYPIAAEKEKLFTAIMEALDLQPSVISGSESIMNAYCDGKTEEDVLGSMRGDVQDDMSAVFKAIREDEFWLYSRPFAIGLFQMMEKVGVELSDEANERWGKALGISVIRLGQDLKIYTTAIERIRDAEQMYKEIEIREKKRLAERLERKAQAAAEKAEEVAKAMKGEDTEVKESKEESKEES
mmetsp:Transcript_17128/g.25030  ORF Transcript_17128/g.25030 Transcript_17128/m.25030 type:complete len:356 (-) Transcript_17128:348-1415(-)|eukprot:CAMPEP_0113943508 /NCGR_PEP_ID=MMETSP1339-20121228/25425_1 /TAXON_ID=94617 /ORGANISM="Fibrocapsa japonica" /LENGTH=355 /DNA_ID=CAMNT_0000948403 /DNA_START=131 /DNA_END=1198 /DNA_ORIENTATION=- /assembly_acc=CAM_ASM_000762